jgi:hypothetical protein
MLTAPQLYLNFQEHQIQIRMRIRSPVKHVGAHINVNLSA